MPPLISQTAVAAPSAPLVQHHNVPPASQYSPWSNPVPSQFTELDRLHALQSANGKFLEMHPEGVRGVSQITKYCFLIIYLNNITTIANTSETQGAPHLSNWNKGPSKAINIKSQTIPTKVIRSNATGKYLCMDDASVVFQQDGYDPRYCLFHHNYEAESYRDRYYRPSSVDKKDWFLAINKDGSVRCGNVTRINQNGSNFYRIDSLEKGENASNSPPFKDNKRKCCTKNKCKRRRRPKKPSSKDVTSPDTTSTDKSTDSKHRRKRCYKNWCRHHRRKFFELKLKNVKRYYNRCIKNKKQIRHCKNR